MAQQTERSSAPRRWAPPAVIGVLAVVYVGVLFLYWRSAQPTVPTLEISEEVAARSLVVAVDATAVDPQTGTLSAQLKIFPPGRLVAANGTLKRRIEVVVVTVDPEESSKVIPVDGATATFEKGAPFLTSSITLYPQGRYQNYPFERYVTNIGVGAAVTGDDGELQDLPTVLGLGGDVPGWVVQSGPVADSQGPDVELSGDGAELTLVRAGSTVAIVAIILLALLVLMTAALLVARSVWVKKRRIEATMASWFAALMFAVIPLRTNLPGSPPMGVWIDFLVVLWVEVGLMIALAIFIASWLSYTPLPDYAPELVAARESPDQPEFAEDEAGE